jgi:pyruvate ferredoxin oxidoreductase alpha subunit
LFNEIRSFAGDDGSRLVSYVYGLGGREIGVSDLEAVFADLASMNETSECGDSYRYIGLRE